MQKEKEEFGFLCLQKEKEKMEQESFGLRGAA